VPESSAYVARAVPRDPSDAGGYFLNACYQGICEKHGPANAEPELGARLAIGADSAGIIVGGPGDKTGPERGEKAARTSCRAGLPGALQAYLTDINISD
jgi:hypothetical protein